jgi:hypothetical protein
VKKPFKFLKIKFQRWKSIPFAPLDQKFETRNVHTTASRAFGWYQNPRRGLEALGGFQHGHIQTYKQTPIIIYRY